jgi:hypothetical protein
MAMTTIPLKLTRGPDCDDAFAARADTGAVNGKLGVFETELTGMHLLPIDLGSYLLTRLDVSVSPVQLFAV